MDRLQTISRLKRDLVEGSGDSKDDIFGLAIRDTPQAASMGTDTRSGEKRKVTSSTETMSNVVTKRSRDSPSTMRLEYQIDRLLGIIERRGQATGSRSTQPLTPSIEECLEDVQRLRDFVVGDPAFYYAPILFKEEDNRQIDMAWTARLHG